VASLMHGFIGLRSRFGRADPLHYR
jgi:hypothetical protein